MFDKQFEQMMNIERSEESKSQTKQLIDQRIKTTYKKEMHQYYTVLCIATALTIILLISSLSSMALPPQSAEMNKSVHIIDSVALKDADADKTYNLQSFFLLSTRHNNNAKWLLQLEKLLQNLVPTENPNLDLSEHNADHLFVQYDNGQNVYYKILHDGSRTSFLDETSGQYFSSEPLYFIVRDHFKGLGLLGILILVALFIIMVNIGRHFFNRIDTEQPSRKDSSLPTALISLVSLATINIYGTVHFGLLGIFYFIYILLYSIYDYKRYKIKTSLAHFTFKTIFIALFLIIIFKI